MPPRRQDGQDTHRTSIEMNRAALFTFCLLAGCGQEAVPPPAPSAPPQPVAVPANAPWAVPNRDVARPKSRRLNATDIALDGALPGVMTFTQFRERYPDAEGGEDERGFQVWRRATTFAGAEAKSSYLFMDGVLFQAALESPATDKVADALQERFGEPSERITEVTRLWEGPGVGVLLQGNGDRGVVVYFTDVKLKSEADRREVEAARRKRERPLEPRDDGKSKPK